MSIQPIKDFGDFFEQIFNTYLTNNSVVKVNDLGYFYIIFEEARIGRMANKEFQLPSKNRLFFFNPSQDTDKEAKKWDEIRRFGFSEMELLEGIKNYSIGFTEITFPQISEFLGIVDHLKTHYSESQQAIKVSTSQGREMLKVYFAPERKRLGRDVEGNTVEFLRPKEMRIEPAKTLREEIKKLGNICLEYETAFDSELAEERVISLKKRD
jgi:hypothetical protein